MRVKRPLKLVFWAIQQDKYVNPKNHCTLFAHLVLGSKASRLSCKHKKYKKILK